MERVIKFRGIRTDGHGWVYGSLIIPHKGNNHYYIQAYDGYCYMVEKETVGQFTGLRDSNGKEIYEGDVVNYFNGTISEDKNGEICYCGKNYTKSPNINSLIVFEGGCFRLEKNNPIDSFRDEKSLIVIDNIHDNPELLKTK